MTLTTISLVRVAVETAAKTMYANSFRVIDHHYIDGRKLTHREQGHAQGKLRGAIIIIRGMLQVEYPILASDYDIKNTIHKLALMRGWTPEGLFDVNPEDVEVKEGGLYELLFMTEE